MKKKPKSLRILRVDWVDSKGLGTTWQRREDIDKTETLPLASVGLEVKSDDENVVLAMVYNAEADDFCCSMCIPRCAIRRVRVLGEVKYNEDGTLDTSSYPC